MHELQDKLQASLVAGGQLERDVLELWAQLMQLLHELTAQVGTVDELDCE